MYNSTSKTYFPFPTAQHFYINESVDVCFGITQLLLCSLIVSISGFVAVVVSLFYFILFFEACFLRCIAYSIQLITNLFICVLDVDKISRKRNCCIFNVVHASAKWKSVYVLVCVKVRVRWATKWTSTWSTNKTKSVTITEHHRIFHVLCAYTENCICSSVICLVSFVLQTSWNGTCIALRT